MSTTDSRPVREAIRVEAATTGRKPPWSIYGDRIYLLLSGKETAGGFTVMEDHTLAGTGPPWHVHHREDELFQVLEGKYVFQVRDRRIEAKVGDLIMIPKDNPHSFQNVGPTTGRTLITVQPSGIEFFFEELAALTGPPDMAKVAAVFIKHGLELLGPPLDLR